MCNYNFLNITPPEKIDTWADIIVSHLKNNDLYIVSDTETTGLKPFGDIKNRDIKDRLIEVAFIFCKLEGGKMVRMKDNQGVSIFFHEYINPFSEPDNELARYNSIKGIPTFLHKVHGITDKFLLGQEALLDSSLNETSFKLPHPAPRFDQIKPILSKLLCVDEELSHKIHYIAHNAVFDTNFLSAEWSKCEQYHEGQSHPASFESYVSVIDTLSMIREMYQTPHTFAQAYQNLPHFKGEIKVNYKLDFLTEFYQCKNIDRDVHGAMVDSLILTDVYIKMLEDDAYLNLPSVKNQSTIVNSAKKIDTSRLKVL